MGFPITRLSHIEPRPLRNVVGAIIFVPAVCVALLAALMHDSWYYSKRYVFGQSLYER